MTALSVGTAEENVLCESLSELMLREMGRKSLVSCGFILVYSGLLSGGQGGAFAPLVLILPPLGGS